MTKVDDNNTALRLRRTRGDALTSPPPLLFLTPPKEEGGRITVTGTCSPITTEGRDPQRGREAPPPVQIEALTFFKEEDSLLEASR